MNHELFSAVAGQPQQIDSHSSQVARQLIVSGFVEGIGNRGQVAQQQAAEGGKLQQAAAVQSQSSGEIIESVE
jgi:hypothetical protein